MIKEYKRYFRENKVKHKNKMKEFLRQPCIPSEGIGGEESADLLIKYYKELGCQEVERIETNGAPGVWAYLDSGADKTIVNYCMLDTKPADPQEWDHHPFEAKTINKSPYGEIIIGRGAQGRKGPYITWLNALGAIKEIEGKLPVNIMFLAESEENLGSPHYKKFVNRYYDRLKTADAAFCPGATQTSEGKVKLILGYKGLLNLTLTASGESWGKGPQGKPIHSMANCIIESPVWRLVEALSTISEKETQKVKIEGFYNEIMPTENEKKAAHDLAITMGNKHWKEFLPGVGLNVKTNHEKLDNVDALLRYWFNPSFNINGLASGYTGPGTEVFRLPHEAWAKCDIRIPRGYSAKETVQNIHKHFKNQGYEDIDVEVVAAYEPYHTDVNSDLVQSITELLDEDHISSEIWPYVAGGGPWSLFAEMDMPVLFDIGIGYGEGAGGINEFLVIDGNEQIAGLIDSQLFFVRFLKRFASK